VVSETIPADFQFAGMYKHERSGLSLTKFRPYSPVYGRFISRDPKGEAEGANLYRYVKNDPLNLVDPLGAQWQGPVIAGLKEIARQAIRQIVKGAPAVGREAIKKGAQAGKGIAKGAKGSTPEGKPGPLPFPGPFECSQPDDDDCDPPVFEPGLTYQKCIEWCEKNCNSPGTFLNCEEKCYQHFKPFGEDDTLEPPKDDPINMQGMEGE